METVRPHLPDRGLPRHRRSRSGFTWVEYCVWTILSLIVLAIVFMPVSRGAREPARHSQCKNNLKQIGLALHNYHDQQGCFPQPYLVDAHGTRLQSWRAAILPFMNRTPLYNTIDVSRPWDDPSNSTAAATPLHAYHCPSDPGEATRTTYLAVVSPSGIFRPGEVTRIKDITDGTPNTLMVLEVPVTRAVPWMSTLDLTEADLQTLAAEPAIPHSRGMTALFADGSVRTITREELAKHARAWLTIAGNEKLD